jgi:hypothetical protein
VSKANIWHTPTGSAAFLPLAMSDTGNNADTLGENTTNSGTEQRTSLPLRDELAALPDEENGMKSVRFRVG